MIPPGAETVPLTRETPNLIGSIQQFHFNGVPYMENMRNGLIASAAGGGSNINGGANGGDYTMTATWTPTDDVVYHAVTFKNHKTYLGLPKMKAYVEINLYFQIRTLEPNGKLALNSVPETVVVVIIATCTILIRSGSVMNIE